MMKRKGVVVSAIWPAILVRAGRHHGRVVEQVDFHLGHRREKSILIARERDHGLRETTEEGSTHSRST